MPAIDDHVPDTIGNVPGVPESIQAFAEMPQVTDMVLYALRQKLPDLTVFTLIPDDPPLTFAIVRKAQPFGAPGGGNWEQLGFSRVVVWVYSADTPGLADGELKGEIIGEAIRVALREAWVENMYVPGHGWIKHVRQMLESARVSDWATSVGPVQYADLPTGYWRFESSFMVKYRREMK